MPDILLGAHVSIAGGTCEAPPRARAIGATAMQIFTKMANRWAERECDDAERSTFATAIAQTDLRVTVAHDSYLINLASPDELLRRRSIESFVAELQRCEALGVASLVSHPGNYIDDRDAGIARNADAITEALERAPGRTVLCLETTAGSGTALGVTLEELAGIIALIPEPHRSRVGVCVDTCHVYSAGYDLVGDYDGFWQRFADVLGLDRLRVLHLNDSKTPFDSRRDRHELIAEGSLGEAPFRRIMTDDRLAGVPKVIETPKLDDAERTDRRMLERLRTYFDPTFVPTDALAHHTPKPWAPGKLRTRAQDAAAAKAVEEARAAAAAAPPKKSVPKQSVPKKPLAKRVAAKKPAPPKKSAATKKAAGKKAVAKKASRPRRGGR